jgi:hypothetical protein
MCLSNDSIFAERILVSPGWKARDTFAMCEFCQSIPGLPAWADKDFLRLVAIEELKI